MFSELFWFVYFLNLVDHVRGLSNVGVVVGVIMVLVFTIAHIVASVERARYVDDGYGYKEWSTYITFWGGLRRVGILLLCVCAPLYLFVPTQEALLAGGGQYVAEATLDNEEVVDTLTKLKDMIDAKIEAATPATIED